MLVQERVVQLIKSYMFYTNVHYYSKEYISYLCNSTTFYSSLQVKPLLDEDVDGVTELVSSLSAEQSILDDVRYYIEGKRDPLNEVQY